MSAKSGGAPFAILPLSPLLSTLPVWLTGKATNVEIQLAGHSCAHTVLSTFYLHINWSINFANELCLQAMITKAPY